MSAGRVVKIILIVFLVGLAIAGIKGYGIYKKAFAPNVTVKSEEPIYFYVKTGDSFEDVITALEKSELVDNMKSLNWTAKRKNYASHVKPGRYLVKNRMSSNELVNMLRSGNQEPLNITFNNVNRLTDFSERIADQLEFESDSLLRLLTDTAVHAKYGFNAQTMPAMFVPNTYEFYWNTPPDKFLDRMYKEYDNFWNRSRLAKAKKLNMTPVEVVSLAAIVNKEVRFDEEKKIVAGLYINRINKGIRLQSDPTLIYAWNDYSIRRVLNKHKKIDSPYNTYKYAGLPPGPICIPDISSIDGVLNYKKHSYLYMCAKPDFSGYHNFAKTLKQHNRNAAAYRRELNKRRIYN